MRLVRLWWLFALLFLFPQFAYAQFPSPPSKAECEALVERVGAEGAGQSSADTRQRIEQYILQAGSPEPQLQNNAGVALLIQGYPNEALWCMAKAVKSNFEQPETLNNIGFALTLLKKYNQAERVLLYTTHKWPKFAGAWVNLARMYLDQGDNRRAEAAVQRARQAEPGYLPAEEIVGRMAVQRRDRRAAAEQAVNIASLDPGNPWVDVLVETAGDSNIQRELNSRVRAIPMPLYFIELDHPINSDYESLVLAELQAPYWGPAAERFSGQALDFNRQNVQMTPDMIAQLPPEMKAALARVPGVTADLPPELKAALKRARERAGAPAGGSSISVLAPSGSRANYLVLAKRLDSYTVRYRRQLKSLYENSELERFCQEEVDRQMQFFRDYGRDVQRGADSRTAMNKFVRRSLESLNEKHSRFIELVQEARRRSNRDIRRHWMSTASLLPMVPQRHLQKEIHYLRQQAFVNNAYYTAQVAQWVELGKRPVQMDRMLADSTAEMLHAAAADRALEDRLAREDALRDWEEMLEEDEGLYLTATPWVGPNLGAFAIKLEDGKLSLSVGEGLIGDVSFDWDDLEFEMGVGPGVSTPTVSGVGPSLSSKTQCVFRLGGPSGAAIGIRTQVQLTIGTPVAGVDIPIRDEFVTIVGAGGVI